MAGTGSIVQPAREIYNIIDALNQEQRRENHDVTGIYEGRLRSHVQKHEGLKRTWEDFMGVPIPVDKLKTSDYLGRIAKQDGTSNRLNAAGMAEENGKSTSMVMPLHPDDKIDVDSMIVNDLRKELKKRQLGTSGRKAELQARLKSSLAEAKQKREAQWVAMHASVKGTELQTKKVRIDDLNKGLAREQHEAEEMDVIIEEANENKGDISLKQAKELSTSSGKLNPMETDTLEKDVAKPSTAPAKMSVADNLPTTMKKQAPKSALKPSKYASSKLLSTPQPDNATSSDNKNSSKSMPHIPTKVSCSSSESSSSTPSNSKSAKANMGKMKFSSMLMQTNSAGSAFKKKAQGDGAAKMREKKKQFEAASEARKVRLAEIRQKARPIAAKASPFTKHNHSHSKYAVSSKTMTPTSTPGESKAGIRLAKMREKAAAEKSTVIAAATKPIAGAAARYVSITSSSSSTTSKSSSSTNPEGCPMKQDSRAEECEPPVLKHKALKSIPDPSNTPSPVPEVKRPAKVLKPLSPMQTYEMSDREAESDSESESDEEYERQRPKKAIPEWAKKPNLHSALEHQFSDSCRLDPDKIFGEVLTCNLEDIFDKKKSRYQRRTSSGNWGKDHVTIAEKLTYKRTMGYGN